jgi:riboflavin kinase/FMN adenylyltransferase
MEVLQNPSPSAELPRRGVVTIGNFDGVHRGHQMLVRAAVERASELGGPAVVLTFHPHPEKVLRPGSPPRLLTTPAQRAQLMSRLGVDVLVELGFDLKFAATPAEDFARKLLFKRLAPREVRLGANFRFGAGRRGDVELLERLGRSVGVTVVGVAPLIDGEEPISSSRVRRALLEGRVAEAWRLLARPYFVDGKVLSGERMGRHLGFPTLNLEVENELMPLQGVYVTVVHIPSFGRVFPSVTNIGVRPTVLENGRETVETHVLDFSANVYSEAVRLFFLGRLREEMRFSSSAELSAQIGQDVEVTRAHFAEHGVPEAELVRR